ncbi:MAG TPA: hypothetical protein VG711_00380, partial [Phycisphaerales bacterium]|nr:hypothetical protein [Phycisphaerales bacterium]
IDSSEKTLPLFDPPMILCYATMKPGEEHTQSLKMRVLDSKTARKQREAGTATHTVRFLGSQSVRSPLGEITALNLQGDFHADLSLANVTNTTSLWITPDLSIIADHSSEQVKILGAIGRNHTMLRALKSAN